MNLAPLDAVVDTSLDIAFVVLHTSPLHQPGTKDAGGMNVVVLAQAEELAREGHRVRLITRRSDEEQPDEVLLESGVRVVHLTAGPQRLLSKGEHEALIEAFSEALLQSLLADPTDLIHAQHWYSGMSALPVARALGIPIVQSYHSIAAPEESPLTEGERPEAPGRLAGERMLAHETDAVITVSEAERATVLERLGGDPLRVRIVTPGVNTELFHPAVAGAVGDAARAELLVAGRLHPLKGIDVAIAAVAAIPIAERPVLRIVGSPPPDGADYLASLHDAVEHAGMSESVLFEGALTREQLAERLREATLVLIPSHSETYGLVALEAAASGVPVVARATGGLMEAVVDGVTGVLVMGESAGPLAETGRVDLADRAGQAGTLDSAGRSAIDEAEVWAHAITGLLNDPGRTSRMRIDARASAIERNWAASTTQLLRVYRELLS